MLVRIYILKSKTGSLDIYGSYEAAIQNVDSSYVATWKNGYYTEFHNVNCDAQRCCTDEKYSEPEYTIERHTIVLDNTTHQVID
jgi:hypothetical protein